MQGGIVCVMILGRDRTHGKGRGVYWLDNIYHGCTNHADIRD